MKIELHLTDGRVLPLSAETVDGILAQLAEHGVTPDLVASTIHIIEGPLECTCRTVGCGHPASAHVGGVCRVCGREGCWR
jgi:hypothetical protein